MLRIQSYLDEEIRKLVHDTILNKIGADLSIIIKEINQLEIAIQEKTHLIILMIVLTFI